MRHTFYKNSAQLKSVLKSVKKTVTVLISIK